MATLPSILQWIYLMGGILVGVMLWGIWQMRRSDAKGGSVVLSDTFLWALLILAVCAVSVFGIFLYLSFQARP